MQSLNTLINRTFLADMQSQPHFFNRLEVLSLLTQKPNLSQSWDFEPSVIDAFQWRLVGLSRLMTVIDGKKHFALHGSGLVIGEELKLAFSDAGFDHNFSFTAGEERKKVGGTTRPVYDPRTAQFSINVGTSAGKSPDFDVLDEDIGQFLTMVNLKLPNRK